MKHTNNIINASLYTLPLRANVDFPTQPFDTTIHFLLFLLSSLLLSLALSSSLFPFSLETQPTFSSDQRTMFKETASNSPRKTLSIDSLSVSLSLIALNQDWWLWQWILREGLRQTQKPVSLVTVVCCVLSWLLLHSITCLPACKQLNLMSQLGQGNTLLRLTRERSTWCTEL